MSCEYVVLEVKMLMECVQLYIVLRSALYNE